MRFSANLGWLWRELSPVDAILAAAAAGFDAVEAQVIQDADRSEIAATLKETGLPLIGLNTRLGSREGDRGLQAVPGREAEAREIAAEAIDWAATLGARHVHMVAGAAQGSEAAATFRENLRHACGLAARAGVTLVIEPLNARDAPGGFLSTPEHAAEVIAEVDRPELRLMFDLYHVQVMGGDLLRRYQRHRPLIAHVQFANAPDRAQPDLGEVNLRWLLPALQWDGHLGAEYRTDGPTEATLGWIDWFR